MSDKPIRVVLAKRPSGPVSHENFRVEPFDMPKPGPGQVLVKVNYLSLDPYMRGRMDSAKSYAKPVEVGEVMEGGTVGEVIESNANGFAKGDLVMGMLGWATHGVSDANALRKLDPNLPVTTALGVLGMPGFTAWHGLTTIGQPKAGETLVVAAATGPVGSLVGQWAKHLGLNVIGVAGSDDKCTLATKTFGFDACLNHRDYATAKELRAALSDAAPDGIDIYFENVGGKVLEAIVPLMNTFGRIPVCGMISYYDTAQDTVPQDAGFPMQRLWRSILVSRLHIQGFIISDHWNKFPVFLSQVAPKVADGTIKYVEDVAEGLENAPSVFMSMLKGRNRGKQLVKVGD